MSDVVILFVWSKRYLQCCDSNACQFQELTAFTLRIPLAGLLPHKDTCCFCDKHSDLEKQGQHPLSRYPIGRIVKIRNTHICTVFQIFHVGCQEIAFLRVRTIYHWVV